MIDHARLQRLLGGEAMVDLRRRLAVRCFDESKAAKPFQLSGLTPDQHAALCGLLSKRQQLTGSSLRTSRAELDTALARAEIADSLRDALEVLDGPLRDLRADRVVIEQRWRAVIDGITEPRLRESLRAAIAFGSFKRAANADPAKAAQLLEQAQRVIAALPAAGRSLAELSAAVLGDAHALDSGRPVANLVLNALVPTAEGEAAERRRIRWSRLGISVNELARPVLMLNLSASLDSPGGRLIETARSAGTPLHLSLRLLLRDPPQWQAAGQRIHVCENPAVVALAADRLGPRCAPLICTDGMPAAAQQTLLGQLVAAGAQLAYHGDFDWPGISIGNLMMTRFAAVAWRFGAEHYRPRPCGSALIGPAVTASWDARLGTAMQAAGLAVHEEAVAEVLLDDLAATGSATPTPWLASA